MTLPSRERRFEQLLDRPVDVAIVGGGITGAGIALDLALRGLRVVVVEKNDWASATSGASSRLVHGGLRYLEQFEFSLVRDSCIERARLLHNAAGLVWPETFLFPLRRGDRVGPVKLALGLGLYTALSVPHALGIPRILGKTETMRRLPGIDASGLRAAGSYLDGSTDDARLTLAIVQSALGAGALALSRVEALAVEGGRSGCSLRLKDGITGSEHTIEAARVVLAGGPFTESLRSVAGLGGSWISATRGSHIVVPRHRLPTDGAVILSSAVDGRVMFLIPWPRYTIVGTTDLDAPAESPVNASREEVQYLLDSANALVPEAGLVPDDVVSTWAGLRPLLTAPSTSPSARSREERVEVEQGIYTIAGGKLTGYRSMAEKLCARLVEDLGRGAAGRRSPTYDHRLVGSLDSPVPRPAWSSLPLSDGSDALEVAWARRYAGRIEEVRRSCGENNGLEPLNDETVLGEVDWAVREEDCLGLADFFLRRTDLGHSPQALDTEVIERVSRRMAAALGWDEEAELRQSAELRNALGCAREWSRL